MKTKSKQITVEIKGTRTSGDVLSVSNKGENWNSDIQLTAEELFELHKLLTAYYSREK